MNGQYKHEKILLGAHANFSQPCNIYIEGSSNLLCLRPKIKIAVVPVTRPTLRFAPKKPDSNYYYYYYYYFFFFVKVVFMLPTSFLTVDISQYYLSVPLVCVKKLVF
jgi:hypothetical protein